MIMFVILQDILSKKSKEYKKNFPKKSKIKFKKVSTSKLTCLLTIV